METKTMAQQANNKLAKIGNVFGMMYSFNTSLKLYHWHVTGKGSYAKHMALDQALDDLADTLDRIVETSYAVYGSVKITIPETTVPTDIVEHADSFFNYIDKKRDLFDKDFSKAILDDYQEAIQQLLYRLRRLE